MRTFRSVVAALAIVSAYLGTSVAATTLPSGFSETIVASGLTNPTGDHDRLRSWIASRAYSTRSTRRTWRTLGITLR